MPEYNKANIDVLIFEKWYSELSTKNCLHLNKNDKNKTNEINSKFEKLKSNIFNSIFFER